MSKEGVAYLVKKGDRYQIGVVTNHRALGRIEGVVCTRSVADISRVRTREWVSGDYASAIAQFESSLESEVGDDGIGYLYLLLAIAVVVMLLEMWK